MARERPPRPLLKGGFAIFCLMSRPALLWEEGNIPPENCELNSYSVSMRLSFRVATIRPAELEIGKHYGVYGELAAKNAISLRSTFRYRGLSGMWTSIFEQNRYFCFKARAVRARFAQEHLVRW